MFTPAMMPVTAGKKIAKYGISEVTPSAAPQFARRFSSEKFPIGPSRKKRIDNPSTVMITYCALIAQSAPFQTSRKIIAPSARLIAGNQGRSAGQPETIASEAPRMLKGIASDCDTKSVSPIEVPNEGPSTRLIR